MVPRRIPSFQHNFCYAERTGFFLNPAMFLEKKGASMTKKIVIIDVLDDPSFDIVEVYRDLAFRVGFPRNYLVGVDGIQSIQDVRHIHDQSAGIIISGSTHNFSDLQWPEWFNDLRAIIREYHGRVPILGICFGHHAIASALDGRIQRHERGREVGSVLIKRTMAGAVDLLFRSFPEVGLVRMSHGDHVVQLPSNAILLAANDHSGVQAFRIGTTWGIQFHPEVTPEIFHKLLGGRAEKLEMDGKHEEAKRLRNVLETVRDCPDGAEVFRNFLAACLQEGGGL